MSGEREIAQLGATVARFQAIWNARVQPHLARNPRVPAQFIVDTQKIIALQLSPPIFELVKVQATGKITSLATRIAGIAVGGGIEISAQATDQVAAAAQSAADTLVFVLGNIIGPIANEAKLAIETGGARATVAIVTSGSDRLDQVVTQAFTAGINAWKRLAEIQAVAQTNLLFRLLESQLEAALAFGRALEELGRVLAAAGKAIYKTVVGLGNLVSLLIKVAIVGGAGYIGYQLYQGYQGTRAPPPAIAAPSANPARRRRRRSRTRAYLR